MKIIQSRLQENHKQTSREEQTGFRPHQGCVNQMFTIRPLMEERIRCSKRTTIAFVDFKSTFDCIHWPTLWKALETEHKLDKIIRLLKATYHGSTSVVRIRAELSEEFTIKTGVRQGDIASPLLWSMRL